jgi:RNA polymerase sigma factor (sigma-70 family)
MSTTLREAVLMSITRCGSVGEQLRTLWSVGAVGETGDAELIARFTERRDEAAEAAFRVLVERHGPMVRRVCRQVLADRDAALDAAQAVFLVLARKAGSVRVRDTIAPWLHGVARRVAAKARCRSADRRSREAGLAVALAEAAGAARSEPAVDWEAVHDEVERLPEKYRTPVVLCYLEGLTYEETARRIGCPVGTVRVRLSRARDRLRAGLSRRGIGPGCLTAAGLADGLAPPPAPAPAGWVEATSCASWALLSGRSVAVGMVPARALALSEGVTRMLAIARWKAAALGVFAVGLTSAGAVVAAGGGPSGQDAPRGAGGPPGAPGAARDPAGGQPLKPKTQVDTPAPPKPTRFEELARRRFEEQKKFYEEGRITIDRLIEASRLVMAAETDAATTKEQRVTAAREHRDRLDEVVQREQAELQVGRGTTADVAEAQLALEQASLALKQAEVAPDAGEVEALRKRVGDLEKRLDAVTKLLDRSPNARPR